MPNRLADSTSPYLLQHKDNPVDWWPWGPEAFAEARRRDVPVLLSVGYAACHWCHVMAHESFEDDLTATVMNESFVNIKVDREERPDVDAVYMEATQALTGQGGWPMTCFLDHEGRAFFAGTYFPPRPRPGMPSFRQLLASVTEAWVDRRADVEASASRINLALEQHRTVDAVGTAVVGPELLEAAVQGVRSAYDPARGGFGGAPKFPPSMLLEFLLRHAGRSSSVSADDGATAWSPIQMVETTCRAMARGGMYDQLGGGFARYSVDAEWVVPHFEKMLYDNALLLRVYLHWWRATADPLAERVVRETAEFLLCDLRTGEGGFASALDADSEGREGAFYVWTPQQLRDVLGDDDGDWVAHLTGVTRHGSFEHGSSVLQLRHDPEDPDRWMRLRARLFQARDTRPSPARDDKVVAAWNGLAIAALAEAGALLDVPEWVDAAIAAADLLIAVHLGGADPGDGSLGDRLVRASRDGRASIHAPGVLEDYADVAEGLLALYQVTGDDEWLAFAGILCDVIVTHFWDGEAFHDTADDAEALVRRPQDPTDNATPSGWSSALSALLTYAALTGSTQHRDVVDRGLGVVAALAGRSPRFVGWGLAVAEAWLDGPREVAVVGSAADPATKALRAVALRSTAPGTVVAVGDPAEDPSVPLLRDRPQLDGVPTAYVCRGFVCRRPVTDGSALGELLST